MCSLPTLALLTALFGCSSAPPAPEPVPEAAEEPAVAELAPEPEEDRKPRAKAYKPVVETLGTLPEGVGVPVGTSAPDAPLEDLNGHAVNLADLYTRSAVLLVFYRGGWCPYCNFQVRELVENWPEFEKRGVIPVMISVDRVDQASKTRQAWETPFPVLSDPDMYAHRAFSVVHEADEAEVDKLWGLGIDLTEASGKDHHSFAIPSIFLVDPTGVVRWAHADRDYKVRPTAEQLLAAIDAALVKG